jgi:molybdopterin molybdotransferase
MITIAEAQDSILSVIEPLPPEEVPLLEGLGRILAEDIVTPFDIPMTDNSAMDGYAFDCASLQGDRLRVHGFLAAGGDIPGPVPPGEAIRIMTGAPLPPGCDTVVPIEETESLGEGAIRLTRAVRRGSHVRVHGEDAEAGEIVVAAGSVVRPQEIGMAASLGLAKLKVAGQARVAILATGDELLEIGTTPVPGKIVNSNSYSLAAQVLDAGGQPLVLGIAPDDLEATKAKIVEGSRADFLVISGGVSVGDRDYVKEAITALGGEILFWKVDMKPGKPVVFAVLDERPVFALPGNPVAAVVGFEMFVRPALLKKMGHRRLFRPVVKAALTGSVQNKGERPHLMRGALALGEEGYSVSAFGNQSSANLRSLTASNALLKLPPETKFSVGDEVEVLLLDGASA